MGPFDANVPCTSTLLLKVAEYELKLFVISIVDKEASCNTVLPVISTSPLKYAVFDDMDGIFESSER